MLPQGEPYGYRNVSDARKVIRALRKEIDRLKIRDEHITAKDAQCMAVLHQLEEFRIDMENLRAINFQLREKTRRDVKVIAGKDETITTLSQRIICLHTKIARLSRIK